jgi:predicted DNA-binding transcriptional regulator AlpA
MRKEIKEFIKNKQLATYRVLNWNGTITKGEICSILGMSRPTLDTRMKKHNWKLKELKKIQKNMPF